MIAPYATIRFCSFVPGSIIAGRFAAFPNFLILCDLSGSLVIPTILEGDALFKIG
jgi:hypothetical protein